MPILEKFNLEGKVAVITGSSKGIGEAMARAFGEAGAKVVISSRKQDAVDVVVEAFKADGIDAIGIAANVGDIEQCQNLIAKTIEHFGGVDILVNNAATNPVFGGIEFTEEWAFDKIMNVNVKAPFELAKLCLPTMRERGGGSIINISSIGGITPEPQLGIYSVSKASLISLTKAMAKEWGSDGIRANVICPGLIKTKFSKALWSNQQLLKHMTQKLPIDRIGDPSEIAGLALFLASSASGYCTGSVFTADGGYTI